MRVKDPSKIPPFGRRLSRLRRDRQLTQEEVATAVGMTREMVSYLEARAPNPTMEVIRTFADFFEVSADVLVYDQEEKRRQGPKSHLEEQFEQIRSLPKTQQKTVVSMLSGLLQAEAGK